jgi:hypothetical protein
MSDEVEWWEQWKVADPRDAELARSLVPFGLSPDQMCITEPSGPVYFGEYGPIRTVELKGFNAPRPAWAFYLNLANRARKAVETK